MANAIHTRLRPSFAPVSLGAGLILLGLMLSACHSTPKPAECDENQGAYLKAQEHAPLNAAGGLATPDRRTALVVPASNGQSIDTKVCLQRAPSYFGTAGRIAASPEEMVADWAQAWADRNNTAVLAMYSSKFETDAPAGSAAWLAQRGTEVTTGPVPGARVSNLKIMQQSSDERLATFTQQFGATSVRKELKLIRDAGLWKIAGERVITTE